jgi:3-methylcrotonyl-CoA carboxylase beta subunit
MPVLDSSLDVRDPVYARNRDAMAALVADLRAKVATIEEGGGATSNARHVARGKLLPRDRIRALIDALAAVVAPAKKTTKGARAT